MSGTYFGAASPGSFRRSVVVTERGLDEVFQLGARRHHAWSEVGAVRWVGHGRAVVCCDRRNVDLAGLADVVGAVAAIEQRIAWLTTPARLSAEAERLGQSWYQDDLEWRRIGVPGLVLLLSLILGRLTIPLLGVFGVAPVTALLMWFGAAMLVAGIAGLIVKQQTGPLVPLVTRRGIRPAGGGAEVTWDRIRCWEVVDLGEDQPARLDIHTRAGTVASLPMSVERADRLSDLLQRGLSEWNGAPRPVGAEPIPDTALSRVRMTDAPADGRGLSLSSDVGSER